MMRSFRPFVWLVPVLLIGVSTPPPPQARMSAHSCEQSGLSNGTANPKSSVPSMTRNSKESYPKLWANKASSP